MGDRYHLDCFSGLAGDMFLGACLDLGMPLAVIEEAVAALGLAGVSVEARRASRGGLAGTRFRVLLDGEPVEGPDPEEEGAGEHDHDHGHDHPHEHPEADATATVGAVAGHHQHDHSHHHDTRTLPQIQALIEKSRLEAAIQGTAANLFVRLGEAEAKAHGVGLDQVHFHEVGALDSIVDLVGAAAAYHHLAPERLTAGPINVGGGTVATAHGRLPVPAPATAWLVRGLPVHGGPGGELLTPTGAVILAELVDEFGDLPPMSLDAAGYGLGKKHVPGRPNAVRLLRGRALDAGEAAPGRVVVLETEVDDLPGEGFGFLMERLLAAGALDVFFIPVQMKKNRPGTLVTVLGRPGERDGLAGVLLAESGSLGCRVREAERIEAEREVVAVGTRFGEVRVKMARWGGRSLGAAPEYEDCRRLALSAGVAWRDVYRAALAAVGE
jgi:pyridinium-3,5-bisthiocarboxylic acid mononucleotide nickel chelatase